MGASVFQQPVSEVITTRSLDNQMTLDCKFGSEWNSVACPEDTHMLLTWHSLCVPKECSMTKLEHKTSLHSSLVRWGESCFLNEVHRSRVYQIKQMKFLDDVQTWHVDVFKLLTLNAGSSSSSYWNSPVNGKWGSQTDLRKRKPQSLFNGECGVC
jgi:hypothetical protein